MKVISSKKVSPAGFSLAETAIAVAIAALGLISIIGLLPQGLELSRRTAGISAETRLLQQVAGEIQAENWNDMLKNYPVGTTPNRFYDDQGLETSNENALKVAYVARIEVPNPNVVMPGSANSDAHPYLRRLVVKVAYRGDLKFNFEDANSQHFQVHNLLIAKTNL